MNNAVDLHTKRIKLMIIVLCTMTGFLCLAAMSCVINGIHFIADTKQDLFELIGAMSAGIFHLIVFIVLIFIIPKVVKGIKKRILMLNKIKSGETKKEVFYITKKGRGIKWRDDALKARRTDYYIEASNSSGNKKRFSLIEEEFDSILNNDYALIEYIDGYEYALSVQRQR